MAGYWNPAYGPFPARQRPLPLVPRRAADTDPPKHPAPTGCFPDAAVPVDDDGAVVPRPEPTEPP